MDKVTVSDLVEKIHAYLDSQISLQDLTEYLAPQLPRLFSLPEPPESYLAATVELGLAEMGSGAISEDQFRSDLHDALREYRKPVITIEWSQRKPIEVSTGATNYGLFPLPEGSAEPIAVLSDIRVVTVP